MQEHQFAARTEKTYTNPVKPRDGCTEGQRDSSKGKNKTNTENSKFEN